MLAPFTERFAHQPFAQGEIGWMRWFSTLFFLSIVRRYTLPCSFMPIFPRWHGIGLTPQSLLAFLSALFRRLKPCANTATILTPRQAAQEKFNCEACSISQGNNIRDNTSVFVRAFAFDSHVFSQNPG